MMNEIAKQEMISLLEDDTVYFGHCLDGCGVDGVEIFLTEKFQDYLFESESMGDRIFELITKYGSKTDLDELGQVLVDYDEGGKFLTEFYRRLEKYNRRLDNSVEDLWEIFLENTTHNPKNMIRKIVVDSLNRSGVLA